MDTPGRSPAFSIPFQSGVGEEGNLGNKLAPPVFLCPSPGAKDNNAFMVCSTPSSSAGPGPSVECGERWGADLVLGIPVGVLKRVNRHRGGSCYGPYSLFSRYMLVLVSSSASFFACGSQITVSLKLLLSSRPSPFDISQTSCQTSEGLTVIPPFHPVAGLVHAFALTAHYAQMAFLLIFLWSNPAQASEST